VLVLVLVLLVLVLVLVVLAVALLAAVLLLPPLASSTSLHPPVPAGEGRIAYRYSK
jgi:hypothetical protein